MSVLISQPSFRTQIINGEITPYNLVRMSKVDFMDAEKKKQQDKAAAEKM